MTIAKEQSVKERLKSLSREKNLSFAELWHNVILERFLARLFKSDLKEKFVWKGGSLLARYIEIGRETRDLDFHVARMKNTVESIEKAIVSICSVSLDDGFSFQFKNAKILNHAHMHYTGAEVAITACLGKTKTAFFLDLGFGDIIEPILKSIPLTSTMKGPLYEPEIELYCYPKEFIFAEKLETLIVRAGANSRMKDFHDLYNLVSVPQCMNREYAGKVVTSVFKHRGTSLEKLPIVFDEDNTKKLQALWESYQKGIQSKNALPSSIEEVIAKVNEWLNETLTSSNA